MRKCIVIIAALWIIAIDALAQVTLKSEGRDTAYVSNIISRSQKIVDKLSVADAAGRQNVLNIIANRYFTLNDIYDQYQKKVTFAKDSLPKGKAEHVIQNVTAKRDAELYKHHFEFAADLSNYLDEGQIEAVKDGMTFGVVKVTYDAYCDMIPSLKDNEKRQILAWLKEAREFSMDAENSKKKHEWFKKYKGRINNYLSAQGYDIDKERQEWYKRNESKKKK